MGDAGPTTVSDEMGLYDGTAVGGPTFGVTGAIAGNTAVTFDRVNDEVTAPTGILLSKTGQWSLEAWVKNISGTGTIISNWDTLVSPGWLLALDGGYIVLYVLTDSGANRYQKTTTVTVNDGNWHHIVVTHNGFGHALIDIYIDGAIAPATGAAVGSGDPGTLVDSGIVIGNRRNLNLLFAGSLDEPAIYDTALSAARIAAHYAAI